MKVRIISAMVAIIIALPFIILGGTVYAFGIGVLAILGFIEVLSLKKTHNEIPKIPSILALISMLIIIYSSNLIYDLSLTKLLFPILALLLPIIFYKDNEYTSADAIHLLGIVLFLGVAFNSFIYVRDISFKMFFFLALIPVITDTFAYTFGIKFGKHKMCPKISPAKSWEGAAAGLVFGTIIPCIFYAIFIKSFSWKIVLGTLILSCIGQMGDLVFSKIKRENGIKDFSNIMPGHGGILDRLDSTIFIFMTYILLTTILF